MQVDFYQLSRDPVERVVPLLAAKAIEGGARVVLVHRDPDQRAHLSEAMWARDGAFLAHGEAGTEHASRQPLLLAGECTSANGATIAILADGEWRDVPEGFARAILLFGADQTGAARALWAMLSQSGHTLRIFKQREDGGWREGR